MISDIDLNKNLRGSHSMTLLPLDVHQGNIPAKFDLIWQSSFSDEDVNIQ